MPNNQLEIELVERYLNGELSESESNQLQIDLKDRTYKESFDHMVATLMAIRAEGRDSLKETLGQWDSESRRPTRKTIRMRTIMGVAASLLLLMVAYVVTRPAIDLQLMADNYLEPYPNVVAPLQKSGDGDPDRYQQAFQFYEMGYYGKAEDIFGTLDQSDEAVEFFRALNALLNEQPEKALPTLREISANGAARFNKPAMWYEAIALIMMDEKREAKSILNQIANDPESPFANSAREILSQI